MTFRRLAPWLLLSGLGACAAPQAKPDEALVQEIHDRADERARNLERLKRDILKVDKTMAVTRKLIVQSKAAPYLPDLLFRLAELYVEKSRYIFILEAEEQAGPSGGVAPQKSSMIAPEVRLLKGKALQIYRQILDEFPDYRDRDKIRFFIAHEYRELGRFPEMLQTYDELVQNDPKSPLVDEALYIEGDYWFDKGDQAKAESFYQRLLDRPKSPARQLAFYKMGWIRLFQKNMKESFKYFESAVKGAPPSGSDKALDIRHEALTELVYTYTEVRPAKDAIPYFEALADDSDTLAFVLGKLANRYWIKQEWANAAPVYRRLLELQEDDERDPERAERLYDCIRNAKGKLLPTAADVSVIVRVAARGRVDFRATAQDRSQLGKDFEVFARDLSTRLQLAAQERQDPRLEAQAAKAYEAYLSLFRVPTQLRAMRKNLAESLFASGLYVQAGRQYEALARSLAPSDASREDLLYSSILSYFTAFASKEKMTLFQTVFARSGIEQLGSAYVRSYPRSPRASTVKFNVAKASYDEGNFAKASELFVAYVGAYPTTKEAGIAAHLALDALHNLGDYEKLIKVAQQLAANPALPSQIAAEMREIAGHSRSEEIDELALRAGEKTGDVAQGLIEFAAGQKGTSQGEMAMSAAFDAYRDKRDVPKMKETAWKFLQQYPKSKVAASALLTLAHAATEAVDYEDAEQAYEEFARRVPGAPQALDALIAAGTLRLLAEDRPRGLDDLERAFAMAPPARRPEIGEKIARAKLDAGDVSGAAQAAERVLAQNAADAEAASVLGRALLTENRLGEAEQRLAQAGQAIQRASRGSAGESEAAGKVFFLLGEALWRQFSALGAGELEKKAQLVDPLTQAYTGAAQLGSGADAVGGLYRIGRVYSILADELSKTPEPTGLPADQRSAFRDQIEKQSAPLRAQADEAFTTCLRKARDLDIVSPFTVGCRTKGEVSVGPVAPGFASGAADPAKILELRQRLARNPNDVESLRALADAYLSAGDAAHARLVLSRILELSEGDAPAQAELGAALWRLGKVGEATASFHRALELDPSDAVAKADLAAMLCRMGDVEGAKAELAGLAAPPAPSFDVDGGYSRCR